jgi:uncharacterized membrane protein
MVITILLLVIVILFLLLAMKSSTLQKLSHLDDKINALTDQIKKISTEQRIEAAHKKESLPIDKRQPSEETIAHKLQSMAAEKKSETKEGRPEFAKPTEKEVQRPLQPQVNKPVAQTSKVAIPEVQRQVSQPEQNRSLTETFFERNPDLEKFIGENLANKIGIAILVLGIGFFVKFAIDQNWINEIGRVFIGILCGGILLGIAHMLRKTFTAFSSVLVGGGIAVLYFTIAIAFHEYAIFSQTVAFLLMVVITGFTVVLSLGYNRVELAVFAILGGFGSPFMLTTGEGNYVVLFTYILILNAGMLVLAYYKKWKIVNIICYVFTVVIFGSWLSTRFIDSSVSMIWGSLMFATLFYLVFFAMNIINNIKERSKFEAIEITVLLSNTFFYYAAGMVILNNPIGIDFRGLFTAALGIFNFIFAYALYKNRRADRNLVFLLIGLVLTFISLAAPIQLDGNYITLFWAAEGVLLMWLSQKSGIALMRIASVIVTMLMSVSLLIDWKQIYIDNTEGVLFYPILNKGYVTSLVCFISLMLTNILLRDDKDERFNIKNYRAFLSIATVSFIYLAHLLELRHHLPSYFAEYETQTVIIGTYNMFFILLILMSEKILTVPDDLKKTFPFWGIVAMGAYLIFYHARVIDARDNYLHGGSSTGFVFHYLLIIGLIASVMVSLIRLNSMKELTESLTDAHWWLFVFFFVFIASAELDHTVLLLTFEQGDSTELILNQNHKIGFPILWGISSFILIAIGFKWKIKMLRIISLALLLVTLLKLFIFDLKDISEGGKIAAFISLGILLLVVSFMYQRLKRILLEDNIVDETEKVV